MCLVAKSCPALETPWTIACQAPLFMGFSREEYWSGLPFPSPTKMYMGKQKTKDINLSTASWCHLSSDLEGVTGAFYPLLEHRRKD